jgi:OmpA-OmpF porin, OOP family
LSERRAGAIRTALTERGIPEATLTAIGFGETKPVVPNDTKENRQKNRRVELNAEQ